ncbi:membrane hypothetical protein [Nitrospina gracilis 3/211]|uniref:F5/8 type C domain-containing protein n=1 Tax=Nitrospina gracilis (strain 3/211) TaxID=1266370 RepID=M1YVX2_NITG3|nr:hypothetical protein [Nitrospina gracilis]CCQ89780.1 membrane hypothetical protein [Nitrospina gracilis 3/211]
MKPFSETEPSLVTEPPGSFLLLSFLITGITALLYVFTYSFALQHSENVIPVGDQYVYITQLFDLIEKGRKDYLNTLTTIVSDKNWYWLYRLSVGVSSPFLIKEPFSICIVNYIFLAIASLSLARLAIRLKLSFNTTFFLSLTFWLAPWIYGYWTTLSLFALQLETSFYWILTIATINSILYALEPKSLKNAFISGLFAGLAVWGRGNSLPYVLFVLFCPSILIFWRAYKTKNRKLAKPALLFLLTFVIFASWFYFFTLKNIAWYYGRGFGNIYDKGGGSIAYFFNNFTRIMSDMGWTVSHFPGVFLTRNPSSNWSVILSWLFHVFTIASLHFSFNFWKRKPAKSHRLILYTSLTAFTVYAANLVMGLVLFSEHFASGELLVYFPMLLMLVGSMLNSFCLLAIISKTFSSQFFSKSKLACPAILAIIILYGVICTRTSTPLTQEASLPKPYSVEKFSKNLDRIVGGKPLNFLWYGIAYNPSIINFYRAKADMRPFNFTISPEEAQVLHENLPNETYNRIVSEEKFKNTFRKVLSRSQYIIIPEKLSKFDYMLGNPGLSKKRKLVGQILNGPESPTYAVKMILHDHYATRLLLLNRINTGNIPKGMDSLEIPYGSNAHQGNYPNTLKYDQPLSDPAPSFPLYLLWDDSTSSFWESATELPQSLFFRFYQELQLEKYTLSSGVHGQSGKRMPVAWELRGSNDGEQWTLVDKQNLMSAWNENEKKSFQ